VRERQLTYQEVLQLVELIKSSSQFSEIRLRSGDLEIELRRGGGDPSLQPAAREATPQLAEHAATAAPSAPQRSPAPTEPIAAAAQRSLRTELPPTATVIDSPMVGTFYRAPEPAARPFVEIGDVVEPRTTVCIIEVMKLMNTISAGCHGIVTAILVDDATPVEHGQPLIVIEPHSQ